MNNKKYSVSIPAKVNLRLAITGKREEFHTIDMIVCPYNEFVDTVELIPDDKLDVQGILHVDLKIVEGYEGLRVSSFARALAPKIQKIARYFKVGGAIRIKKHIPLGAGLGGSSAVLAGVVKTMYAFAKERGDNPVVRMSFLLSLGSDVPYMIRGGICRVQGCGEKITPLNLEIPEDLIVRIPEGGVSSVQCYKRFDLMPKWGKYNSDERELTRLLNMGAVSTQQLLGDGFLVNALTEPAVSLNPRIGYLMNVMRKSYEFVMMTGSGCGVVGMCAKRPGDSQNSFSDKTRV